MSAAYTLTLYLLCMNECNITKTNSCAHFHVTGELMALHPFTNAACTPSLTSNGKTTCRTKKSSREPASLPSLESSSLQVQRLSAGHVTRMEDVHMPKAAFFSELQEGKRDRGVPRKHYKDQLKRQLAQAGISHQS